MLSDVISKQSEVRRRLLLPARNGKQHEKISDSLDQDLRSVLCNNADLLFIAEILRKYKQRGVQPSEINLILADFRSVISDEVLENKVLEVMDIVSGFCSPYVKIW